MSDRRKQSVENAVQIKHPARPVHGDVDMKSMFRRTAARYSTVLAELAK